jgi:XapX domain-containing protein
MRTYLASLILGVAVGVVYGLVKVRSPAPPAIALLGLLGMLVGEQAVTLVRSHAFKSIAQLSAASHVVATSDDVRGTEETDGAPTN